MAGKRGRRNPASSPGSLSRSATYDDIPKDDEDLFESGRDQILLDSKSRQIDSDDDMDVGLDDQEVLGIDTERSDDSDADLEQDLEGEEEDDYSNLPKKGKTVGITVSSDEDPSDEDDDEDEEEDDIHENDRGWGSNKRAYYNSNDLDAIDSDSEIDEEQARELELKEVKRLQKKSRGAMDDSDFGLGDDEAEGGMGKAAKDAGREERRRQLDVLDQPLQPVQARTSALTATNTTPSSRQELLAKLQKESPETVALAGEFADMIEEFAKVDTELKRMMAKNKHSPSLELLHLHHQTLVTYITTMTFYFHLRASPEFAADPAKLRQHPVLLRMMRLKQGLSAMEEMGLTVDRPSLPDLDGFAEQGSDDFNMSQGSEDDDLGDLDSDELAELTADAEEKENTAPKAETAKPASSKNSNKSNGRVLQSLKDDDEDLLSDPADHDSAISKKPKKVKEANKKAKVSKTSQQVATPLAAGFADLDDEPTPEIKVKRSKNGASSRNNPFAVSSGSTNLDDATFGELSELSAIDSAERAARKKSLQFHASAIENKALQRSKAARERQSGDADIPYRDRERSRAAVEATKASQQANQQLQTGGSRNTRLDGDDGWGESDEKDWREVMGQTNGFSRGSEDAVEDDDTEAADYYDLIASSRKRGRAEAKAEYDQERDAERFALMQDATLEDGQHRGITRQIEKNKGLTPHRPKSSRNPRVKKRLKYEQAKKKLGSRQAVFKGGQASLQGGYGGEASGISTHLVKSRKLG